MPGIWPKPSISPSKKNSRVALRLFVVFFALAVFSLPFIPASTSAADESPSQIGKAWQAGIALGNCAESDGFNESRSASDLDNGEWYYEGVIGGSRKNVGFLTEPSDGQIRCESGSDIKILLGHLGTDGRTLLRETGIYALNGGTYERKLNGAAAQAKIKEWVQNKFGFNYNNGLSNATKYALLHAAFEECNQGEDPGGVSVKEIDNEGNEETNKYVVDGNKKVRVGYSLGGDSNMELTCSKIVSDLNSFAGDYAARVKELGGVNDGTGAATETEPSCESEGGAMSWLMCPAINAIDSALQFVDAQIQGLLEVDSNYYANDNIKNVFSNIRNIAFVILVPISLVMVLGTVMGFDFISAYTVKRAFPRLVIAIIFISLSYQICFLLISFFNELGSAVLGIISAPFGDANSLRLTTMFAGGILEGIASGIVGIVGIVLVAWLFGGTILLFSAVAFLVLLLRQMFIVVLMLAAPLAILAWIFPGNDKLWKLWWGSFSKLLMMYPIIMALIAMGRIFAYTIDSSNAAGIDGAVIQPIMTLVAYTIPYALIPFTFKLAGGMFATVAGMANDRSKGLFDRQRKAREAKVQRAKQGNMFRNAPRRSIRGGLNTLGAGTMNIGKAGLRPSRWRSNMRSALGNNTMTEAHEAADKLESYQSWKGDDELNRAAVIASTQNRDIRDVLRERGYAGWGDPNVNQDSARRAIDLAASRVERTRREVSEGAFQQMVWLSAVSGGTAYDYTDDSSGAEAWRDAGVISRGDDGILASLVAKGRSAAMSAGRVDQGGAGFGATFSAAQALRDGQLTEDQAAAQIHRSVVESQGPGVLGHASMKPRSIQQLVPELRERLIEARENGDDAYNRELAIVASIYDSMASSSPQNARILADQVLRWSPDRANMQQNLTPGVAGPVVGGGGPTVQEMIRERRSDPVFQSTRREYNDATQNPNNLPPIQGQDPGAPARPPTAPPGRP